MILRGIVRRIINALNGYLNNCSCDHKSRTYISLTLLHTTLTLPNTTQTLLHTTQTLLYSTLTLLHTTLTLLYTTLTLLHTTLTLLHVTQTLLHTTLALLYTTLTLLHTTLTLLRTTLTLLRTTLTLLLSVSCIIESYRVGLLPDVVVIWSHELEQPIYTSLSTTPLQYSLHVLRWWTVKRAGPLCSEATQYRRFSGRQSGDCLKQDF